VFDLAAETLNIRSSAGDIFGILKAQRRDLGREVNNSDDVGDNPKSFHDRFDSHVIINRAE
jgi:hypothetical protein